LACDSNTYTSTGSSCSSGTSLFQISGNSYITTNVPTGTYTTDNHPFNMDEWARLLYEIGVPVTGSPNQTVTTYTIDVYNAQENGTHTSLMLSAAAAGGGKYYSATNQQAIVTAITKITSEILAVNSNFSSASLPASVNAQGTYRNQVFIGMFRPNADSSPRWLGNMKQYQLGYDANGALGLFDDSSPPQSAVSNTTGFLTPSAKSFWTNSVPNYWPDESPYATSYGGLNGSPDGELVEKGGAAQKLRALSSASNRNTLTCVSPCSSLIPFTAGNTGLNSDLVSWALGATSTLANTAAPDDATLPSGYAMRRSAHGDVVHSRPVAIDFGSGGAHDVKVFYGANDGFLHAITANTTSTEGGELWSFIAPEQWSNLNRLYNNSPNINNPSIPGSSNNKTYFFDGPIGNYRSSDNTTTWIFPTTRRGGRMIYAFDVSNSGGSTPTSPNNPTLLWRHGCTTLGNDTGCDSGWSSIGQTWSQPTAISVSGYTDPVLIMGGGYDNCEDADPVVDCSASKGKSVMLIDATAGTLLASLATDRAVATDMALLDTTGDQKVDTAYAVDTGGNVYRIKLNYNGTDWSNSTITKIAALGCNTTSATCTQSKFLNAPSAIALSGYNMVLVGSGDREHPLRTNTSNGNNEFFMIEDRSSNPLIGRDMLAQADPTTTGYSGITPTTYGWRLELPAYKEAVVTSSVVAGQGVYFSTFSPTATTSASVCTADLGTAKACAVKWQNAAPLTLGQNICDTFPAGGLPPSPILVTVTDIYGASSGNGTNGSPSTATVIIGGYPANTTVPLTNPSSCATDPTTCVCGTATTPPCPAYCGNPTVPTCNPAAPIQGCYTPVSAACQRAGVYWNMEKD
jgi:Tfp pilus tip-associated adhesin PilY1